MSRSPTKESTSDEIMQYDVGWVALNKMIRQGKSFSGGERNCAFLNLGGGGRFATVSGATGLDLIDDARGLGVCDWDYDGKVDFWVSNRNGPRLRFLHNRFDSGNSFVALRMIGTKSNRDAIGARLKVEFVGDAPPIIATVTAGSGYVSQSSKWRNIGIAKGSEIAAVSVRWPGGAEEKFSGVVAGNFYHLTEGEGTAAAWAAPVFDRSVLDSEPIPISGDGGAARVLPIARPPMPASLSFTGSDGKQQRLDQFKGAPLLVQLWATWCPNCKAEMVEWKAAATALENTGVKVLPLCVDEPTSDRAADLSKAASMIAERGYPWATGLADSRLIDHLNVIQKAYIGRQEDLPLPSAFLIDGRGSLVAIYKGNVDAAVVIADLAIAKGGESRSTIAGRALPYNGKWLERPPGTLPRSIAIGLVENGLDADAKLYLEQMLPRYAKRHPDADEKAEEDRQGELAEYHTFLGAICYDAGDKREAAEHYVEGLKLNPFNRKMRHELMRCYVDLGEPANAAEQVEVLLEERPDDFEALAQLASLRGRTGERDRAVELYGQSLALRDHPETRNALANILRDLGRAPEAVTHYRAALAARPSWPLPANNLAWILATHPDESARDGAEAVRIAQAASDATGGKIPQILSTLAAAQAEAGDYPAAISALERAIALAVEVEDDALANRLRARKIQFAKGEPTRDPKLLPDAG